MSRSRRLLSIASAIALASATTWTYWTTGGPAVVLAATCTKQLAYQDAVPQVTADGARETWTIRTLSATDTAAGGFASEVLWVGTNGQGADSTWVEVGVTDGWEGSNVTTFYSAHGTPSTYDELDFFGYTPVVGQTWTFTVRDYTNVISGAYVAEITRGSSYEATWWNGHSPNTSDLSGGLESTCNNSRIDKTYVSNIWYRNKATKAYALINNGSLVDQSSEGGIAWCTSPTKFRYYLHSSTGTTLCQP